MSRGIQKDYKNLPSKVKEDIDEWFKPFVREIKNICRELKIDYYNSSICIKYRKYLGIQSSDIDEMKLFLTKRKTLKGLTKEKFIFVYGEDEGNKRWNNYCNLQAETNTKEYKMRVHGMSSKEVDAYNASRAVTLANCIKRHGEEKGRKVFLDYVNKQKDAGTSLSYFISKYGEDEGRKEYERVCKSKKLTLETFIKKYGEENGQERYISYVNKIRHKGVSLKETLFGKRIRKLLSENEAGEDSFPIIHENGYIIVDYVNTKYRFAYEYNGVDWHAKPTKYKAEDTPKLFIQGNPETAQEIWDRDKKRADIILNSGIVDKVFIVWEDDEESGYQEIKEYINECRNNT